MESMKNVLASLDTIIASAEDALKKPAAKDDANGASNSNTVPASMEGAALNAAGEGRKAGKKQKKKKEKAPPKPVVPPSISQFLQCDLRVGVITSVRDHPDSDALYALSISYGPDEPERSVCAGLRGFVDADTLKDAAVVTICNLKPRTLRGIKSEAMILAGSVRSEGAKEAVTLLKPPVGSNAGDIVAVKDMLGDRTVTDGKFVSGKTWDKVVPRLVVRQSTALYDGSPLIVGTAVISCDLPDGAEIH